MRRLLSVLLLSSVSLGCGSVFVGANLLGSSVSGTVSLVQVSFVAGVRDVRDLSSERDVNHHDILRRPEHPVPHEPVRSRKLQSRPDLRQHYHCDHHGMIPAIGRLLLCRSRGCALRAPSAIMKGHG